MSMAESVTEQLANLGEAIVEITIVFVVQYKVARELVLPSYF